MYSSDAYDVVRHNLDQCSDADDAYADLIQYFSDLIVANRVRGCDNY